MTLKRLSRGARSAVLSGALALTGACQATDPDPIIRDDGTMERSVEGCFRIVTQTGTYQPLTLAEDFQVDGLAVYFEASLKPTFNNCMAGDVVELLRIERRQ